MKSKSYRILMPRELRIITLLLVFFTNSALATKIVVFSTSNDGPGTLRAAVEVSNLGFADTIQFDPSLNGRSFDVRTGIFIQKRVAIIGNGQNQTFIEGTDLFADFGIFVIENGTLYDSIDVRIQDLTIFNHKLTTNPIPIFENGAAIHNSDEVNLLMKNVTILGCIITNGGGAIYNSGNLEMIDCILKDNVVRGNPGGGALYNAGGTANISNTVFSNNWAWRRGGAIYNTGTITLMKTVLLENKADAPSGTSEGGAGLYNDGVMYISDSEIKGNTTDWNSAGIKNEGDLTVDRTYITGNMGDQSGGGILNLEDGHLILRNSVISGNRAGAIGGGLYNSGNAAMAEVINSTIAGNIVLLGQERGGGFYQDGGGTTMLTNSIIAENTANTEGPDLFNSNGIVMFNGSNIFGSTPHNVPAGWTEADPKFIISVPTAPSSEGDLRLGCGSIALDMGTADTTNLGLGLLDIGGLPRIANNRIDIGAHERPVLPTNPTVTNINDAGPGSLRLLAELTCEGDTIMFDPSTDGDTIKLSSGELLLSKKLTLLGNNTTNTIIDGTGSSRIFHIPGDDTIRIEGLTIQNGEVALGAGILNQSGLLTCSKVKIQNNDASRFGGGIYGADGSRIFLEDSFIIGNNGDEAGGLYIEPGCFVKCNRSVFSKNATRIGDGSAILNRGVLHAHNSVVSDNLGSSAFGNSDEGTVVLINFTMAGNGPGNTQSGALENGGTLELTNSIIANNSNLDLTLGFNSGAIIDNGFNLIGDTNSSTIAQLTHPNTQIGIDPNFIRVATPGDAEPSDLRLWCSSPAIDAGTPDTTGLNIGGVDVIGLTRIVNERIDIGAYEYFSDQLPAELILNNSATVKAFEAAKSIRAIGSIDDNDYTFRAEQSVILDRNFNLEQSDTLEVLVDKCEEGF